MRMSAGGFKMLQGFESCRLTAYLDTRGVWTIGWGHTGPEVCEGLVWNQIQCDAAFVADIAKFEASLTELVTVQLNDYQWDAFVSMTYNVGEGTLQCSDCLKALNLGNMKAAANDMMHLLFSGGQPLDDLYFRRKAERAWFLTTS